MTAIERCIKEAVEKGGWKPNGITPSEKNIGWWIKANGDETDFLLDPLFWQALGKAKGWKDLRDQYGNVYRTKKEINRADEELQQEWLYHWHRFIDHLAEGKTAEEFFAELV